MQRNIQIYIKPLNVLIIILLMVCNFLYTSCSRELKDIEDDANNKGLQFASLSNSIDSLMRNSKWWYFETVVYDKNGPQIVFQDSIVTLEIYQRLLHNDGFIEGLILKYDSLPDNGYLFSYSSAWDYCEAMHFRYELILCQEEILNTMGERKIGLLEIVTRKYEGRYEKYKLPFFARASGACLTSRILKSLVYQPLIDELDANEKLQMICSFSEPIENMEDFILYEKINSYGISYLKNLK